MPKNKQRDALREQLMDVYKVEESFFDNNRLLEEYKKDIKYIPVDIIIPNPYQPRKEFEPEKLNELATSIKEHGVFQPIIVCAQVEDVYTLVAGERRLRAAIIAGLKEIPALIRDYDKKFLLEVALLENLQRENLNTMEIAASFKQMSDLLGYSQEDIAKRVGKSREYVANILRLLKLPEFVKEKVVDNELSAGHARALLSLPTDKKKREVTNDIIEKNLSVRDTEILIKKENSVDLDFVSRMSQYEENLKNLLETDNIKISKKKIEIEFFDESELINILDKIAKR